MTRYMISASVVSEDEGLVNRAAEILARTASGLALEGMAVSIDIGRCYEVEADS